jgi:hypothetical protein
MHAKICDCSLGFSMFSYCQRADLSFLSCSVFNSLMMLIAVLEI